MTNKSYLQPYPDRLNSRIAFPLGGIGAGMIALEGRGALSHISLRHHPDLTNEPIVYSAICIKNDSGNIARVLEGQVPDWKIFSVGNRSGMGHSNKTYGLPRFEHSTFQGRFPFGTVRLEDDSLPLSASIQGWSPFIPLDAGASSLPVAGLEYTFHNHSNEDLDLVYSFHAENIMSNNPKTISRHEGEVLAMERGFILNQEASDDKPWAKGALCAFTGHPDTKSNPAWFRGGWFDMQTMLWKSVQAGECLEAAPYTDPDSPSLGGSLYVPIHLTSGQSTTIRLMLAWYVPMSDLAVGVPSTPHAADKQYHAPWYAGQFTDIQSVSAYWAENYDRLKSSSAKFSECLYENTLPPEIIEAVAANLCILKSPTVLRQTNGKLWGWEGSNDATGSCPGSCTHVWNYAQALPHLFSDLERGLRETEFNENQDAKGHQNFRAILPISETDDHRFYAAADGQLGGIMKVYREWRISGDTDWLKQIWPKVKQSLQYCIDLWDPMQKGVIEEPHHNTYDIEFWGPNGMCTSIYLGALKAASLIANALDDHAEFYETLYLRGRAYLESELFNGQYFVQKVQWEGLRTASPAPTSELWNDKYVTTYSPEAAELLKKQGPKYQYGYGCLSDGIIGAWFAEMCGIGEIIDREKVKSHLLSVYRHNMVRDFTPFANPQRPNYAFGKESGLVLCTWPNGGQPDLPFIYSNEVWTGIEYQVASHLITMGCVEEGLEIVRNCRSRYDGRIRNPFNEFECGHWYARAMSSYGLIQAFSGARYDAVERKLYLNPAIDGDFASFFCTAEGYGIVGIRNGKPFLDVHEGSIIADEIITLDGM